MRLNLLFGRFNYADRGVLDITHKRVFTLNSFKELLYETGYDIKSIQGIGIPFNTLGKSWIFKLFREAFSSISKKIYPKLFAFQFLAIIKPKLTTYQIIEMNE